MGRETHGGGLLRRLLRWPGPLVGCAVSACAPTPADFVPPLPVPALSASRFADDVAWLAADEREGRSPGSEGLARAAEYLADAFRGAGLAPGGSDGGYLQRFEMPVAIEIASAELELGGARLERGRDFEAFLASASGLVQGDAVFAGYGISAPDLDYDDYAGLDVKGRIVLVLDERPGGNSPLAGERGTAFLRRGYKLANARGHGAAAVLIAPTQPDAEGLAGSAGDEPANPTVRSSEIPGLGLSHAAAERIVAAAGGPSLEERLRSIEFTKQPASESLSGVSVKVNVEIARKRGEVANVLGVLEGSDPALRREVLVIGAHYDHLGRGAFGSLTPNRLGEIHNGADDNASGTAGLLELARVFGAQPPARRTLVLAAFSAEEAGLLGSREYVRAPPYPIQDTVAMINLDMIGRLQDHRLIVFGGETSASFPGLVKRAARGLPIAFSMGEGSYAPSDQTSFYTHDVPVLFFHTGPHTEYHTPDDDSELVDAAGAAQLLQMVYRTARALLDTPERPTVVASRAPPTGAIGPGYGPDLGTVPDMAESEASGVTLQGVRGGSPAERAGLRAGDRIVAFDGAPVANLREYAALLYAARPGQRVEIVVVRDGERVAIEATLGQRR